VLISRGDRLGSDPYYCVSRSFNSLISPAGLNAPLCLSFPIRMLNRFSRVIPLVTHPFLIPVEWVEQEGWQISGLHFFFLSVKFFPLNCLMGSRSYQHKATPAEENMWRIQTQQQFFCHSGWNGIESLLAITAIILERRGETAETIASELLNWQLPHWMFYLHDSTTSCWEPLYASSNLNLSPAELRG